MKAIVKGLVLIIIAAIAFLLWLRQDEQSLFFWRSADTYITDDETTAKHKQVHVTRQDGSELCLDMEEYLIGVLASEMSPTFAIEALKAQSVAARTYVVQRGYEVDDTTNTQVYHDDEQLRSIWKEDYATYHKRIQEAVMATDGEILTYEGKAISALFYSSSCGKSAPAAEYWGNEVPYLQSVDSHWDKDADGYEQTVVFTAEELAQKLGFTNPVSKITDRQAYASGYVKSITIDTLTFTGRQVREKLELRSSCFTIEPHADGYHITTKGYGHGVGMSQHGAQGMAEEGSGYQEILAHYYPGAKLGKQDV